MTKTTAKIKQLPEVVVNKISAGEVIERPAYAVKELVENALDAGASQIKVFLEEAGLKKMIVTDNGHGMSREDLLLSFQRSTSSKIYDETDLERIRTFGFRGEALASIAAVAKLTIRTKLDEDAHGWMVEVNPGVEPVLSVAGVPNGTSVTVEQLFLTVPVRKKFMKSNRTELRLCVDMLTDIALAHPEVGISLTHHHRLLFDLPAQQSLVERIKILLGSEVFNNLVPIEFDSEFFKVHGFISKPQLAGKSGNKQHLFVNKRRVSNNMITAKVRSCFGTLLEPGLNPIYIMFIELPYEMVDVNVHPRKEEVSFLDNDYVAALVDKAVSGALLGHDLTFKQHDYSQDFYIRDRKTDASTHYLLREEVTPWDARTVVRLKDRTEVMQVHNLYIIAETDHGIMIVDQHAAHERILYEQFKAVFTHNASLADKTTLDQALLLNLSVADSEVLQEHLHYFTDLGFEIEPFQHHSYKVNAVPKFFAEKDITALLLEVIDDLSSGLRPKDVDHKSNKALAFLACRSAIKDGDVLSKDECLELLAKLNETTSQYTCPHGRPVKIEISKKELGKLFRR